ncbi:MAG: Gfo/Idh/MocA family oxidoreductase [Acidobacteria bacterium]|nr:Gfo/Idh/MocA family oxidoreductase [Acidobacteriota bacterium]MCI0621356.1 Gfo/Idh/MocA family oxidoreductase [Acidobacteriota bacterium]MCI0720097.1 Gfo/Idh/MocA family oxidoreductase [Acidobacteriota bacterium]
MVTQHANHRSKSQINLAILGAGNMGRRLAKSFQGIPEVLIKYVYSRALAQADSLASLHGARAVKETARIFEDTEVDVVVLCLPTFTRLETLKPALEFGKHVFCEKPLALNQAMADEMRDLLAGYPQTVMVGQVLRFFWEYARLRARVLAGDVGQVGTVRLSRCVGYPGAESWFADPDKSGGVILDLLIHDLDFLRWTFGEVKQVFAKALTHSQRGKLDYALLNLLLQSGALAHIEGSWAHPVGSFHQTVEICGSLGMLHYDNLTCQNLKVVSTAEAETGPSSRISLPEADPSNDPYVAEARHFIDCIRNQRKPDVPAEDSLKSCELAFRCIESARQGVPLPV